MRKLLLAFFLLQTTLSRAQEACREFVFTEIGWTICLPSDFEILDSIKANALQNKGVAAIDSINDIKLDMSDLRTLINATKNKFNLFNSTIRVFDKKTEGDYDSASKSVNEVVFKTLSGKIPDANIDSLSTKDTLDGIEFNKFRAKVSINDKVLFNMIILSRLYKNYDFGITYLYLDDKTKQEIEAMLYDSKFSR